jgi:hypothetical protein
VTFSVVCDAHRPPLGARKWYQKTHLERNAAMCLRVSTHYPTAREPVPMAPPTPAAGSVPGGASKCQWRLVGAGAAAHALRVAVPRSMLSHCSLRACACVSTMRGVALSSPHSMPAPYPRDAAAIRPDATRLAPETHLTFSADDRASPQPLRERRRTQEGGYALAETVVWRRGSCEIRAQIEP